MYAAEQPSAMSEPEDEPDEVHTYPDITVERRGSDLRLLVRSELLCTVQAAGLRCAELDSVASGTAPQRETRRVARALLARCRPTRYAVDCLLDVVLGIDEACLLPHLRQAALRTLRLYDIEHTHLLRPPCESWTPYAELRAVVGLVPLNGVLADLGAGSGRCAVSCALLRPDVTCHCFELVAGRVALARRARRRLGVRRGRCPITRRNLATSRQPLPAADVFFLFNPFSPATLRVVLAALRTHAARQPRGFQLVLKAMEWMDGHDEADEELREREQGGHEPPWGLEEWLRPDPKARLPQGLRVFRTRKL